MKQIPFCPLARGASIRKTGGVLEMDRLLHSPVTFGAASLVVAGLVLACLPVPGWTQNAGATSSGPVQDDDADHPREPSRMYLAMWTSHLRLNPLAFDNNWAFGLSYRGFFGATFLNSYGRRAFTAGWQRTLVSGSRPGLGIASGVRLGLISGYDDRLMPLAGKTPVLPLIQPFVVVDVGHVGLDVSYTFVVVSLALSYRF
jgi:hypothetical protein